MHAEQSSWVIDRDTIQNKISFVFFLYKSLFWSSKNAMDSTFFSEWWLFTDISATLSLLCWFLCLLLARAGIHAIINKQFFLFTCNMYTQKAIKDHFLACQWLLYVISNTETTRIFIYRTLLFKFKTRKNLCFVINVSFLSNVALDSFHRRKRSYMKKILEKSRKIRKRARKRI